MTREVHNRMLTLAKFAAKFQNRMLTYSHFALPLNACALLAGFIHKRTKIHVHLRRTTAFYRDINGYNDNIAHY